MKKNLLALLASGAIGCAASSQGGKVEELVQLKLFDPYPYTGGKPTERSISVVKYFTTEGEARVLCMRAVYASKNGSAQSYLASEHCVSIVKGWQDEGKYFSIRFEDTDGDGEAEKVCTREGLTYLGFTAYNDENCTESDNKMLDVLVSWHKYPYQRLQDIQDISTFTRYINDYTLKKEEKQKNTKGVM